LQGFTGVQGNVRGGRGFKGPQGFPGFTGSAGAQGSTGFTGPTNFGPTGVRGARGAQGVTGFQGPEGQTGLGPTGRRGFRGFAGATGVRGVIGVTGFGPQGAQGVQGVQGPQGATGPQGLQGPRGDLGAQQFEITSLTETGGRETVDGYVFYRFEGDVTGGNPADAQSVLFHTACNQASIPRTFHFGYILEYKIFPHRPEDDINNFDTRELLSDDDSSSSSSPLVGLRGHPGERGRQGPAGFRGVPGTVSNDLQCRARVFATLTSNGVVVATNQHEEQVDDAVTGFFLYELQPGQCATVTLSLRPCQPVNLQIIGVRRGIVESYYVEDQAEVPVLPDK